MEGEKLNGERPKGELTERVSTSLREGIMSRYEELLESP